MTMTPIRSRSLVSIALLAILAAASASAESPVLDGARRAALLGSLDDAAFEPWQREFLAELVARPAASTVPESAEDTVATSSAGTWSMIPPPSARYGQTAVYDIIHDRMIVFGGSDNFLRNDVWLYSFSTFEWTRLKPAGFAPSERYRHSAIYDLRRDRVIVFAGDDEGNDRNDVWTLTLSGRPAWSQLATFGNLPPVRREHTAIFDAGRDRMIVMGGTHDGVVFDDVWALSLSGLPVWTRLEVSGTPKVYRHAAIYDPLRERMLVFGGDDGSALQGAVWALSLVGSATWSLHTPAGGPSARGEHTAIYDASVDRMIVYGGFDGTSALDDVWSLPLGSASGWTRQSPTGAPPSARYRHSAIFDPIRKQMLVYGGLDPFKTSDIWALSGSMKWRGMSLLGTPPSPRSEHSAVYDPVRDRVILFGGHKSPALLDETWVLDLTAAPRWTKMNEPDPTPAPRLGHTAVYDPGRDRMILWGGVGETGAYFEDCWQLSLSGSPAWTRIATQGEHPPARAWHSAIYDHERNRMIVWGGAGAEGMPNETWALSLGATPTWSRIAVGSRPPLARANACAVYDPLRERMLVLGGNQYTQQAGVFFDDLWSLDLVTETWSNVAYSGVPQGLLSATYDPLRDRIVALNSTTEYRSVSIGAFEMTLAGPPIWTALVPAGTSPSIRERSAIYDPIRDRALLFGGDEGHFLTGDTWVLSWNRPTRPEIGCLDAGYHAGDEWVDARFLVTNPLPGDRALSWKLTDTRHWPGLPLEGMTKVAGAASETLHVRIPVPATPTTTNRLRLSVCYCGAEGAEVACERDVADIVTATLASLISAETGSGFARLRWQVSARSRVTIERRQPDTGWRSLGQQPVADGLVTIEDHDVRSGERYGYRLAWTDERGAITAGEQWVDVPRAFAFALHGARPNPASDRFAVAFTLPSRGRIRLEVFDLAGRTLGSRTLDGEAGFHVVPFAEASAWRPGLYLVRISFGARTLESRVALIR
jgi:hypothetical protein